MIKYFVKCLGRGSTSLEVTWMRDVAAYQLEILVVR